MTVMRILNEKGLVVCDYLGDSVAQHLTRGEI